VNKRTLSEKVSDEIEKKDEDEVDSYGQLLIEVRRFVASCPSHWRLGMYEETPMTAVVYQSAYHNVQARFRKSGFHRVYRGWFRHILYEDEVLWKMLEGRLKE